MNAVQRGCLLRGGYIVDKCAMLYIHTNKVKLEWRASCCILGCLHCKELGVYDICQGDCILYYTCMYIS